MKKLFAFVLAAAVLLSMALPAAALASPSASAEDLIPELDEKQYKAIILHTPEDVVKKLSKAIQDLMTEAKAKLKDACPEGFAVKYFYYVEIIGYEEPVSVDFEPIECSEIIFKQYIDGVWVELEHTINEDGTLIVYGVVEALMAVFVK